MEYVAFYVVCPSAHPVNVLRHRLLRQMKLVQSSTLISSIVVTGIVREYVFFVFFQNPKNVTFYVFLK